MPLRDRRLALALPVTMLLGACDMPQSAHVPDQPNMTLAADARITQGMVRQSPGKAQQLGLVPLIDMAQKSNPRTRAAWARAKEAAAAVGLVESTYLPRLSAEILSATNWGSNAAAEDPLGLLPRGTVHTKSHAAVAALSIQWLVFDFGVREASRKVASEVSLAANVGITGVHQALIFEVASAYYDLQAATAREALQARRLTASEEIAAMLRARQTQQLATVTDVAQADQFVAQARFDLTTARSGVGIASTKLATVVGLPPGTRITPDASARLRLPSQPPARIDEFVNQALQRRPDLQMAFANARASRAGVDAVEALFRPKIVATAALGRSVLSGSFGDSRFTNLLGTLSAETHRSVKGVFVGVSIPLWDANASQLRRESALALAAAAEADAEELRRVAEGEIIAAYETLKAALASSSAAGELVRTARLTYDAARSRVEQGLATIAEVDVALKLLYDAEIAQVEAIHAARAAAALLAFAGGQIGEGL